MLKFLLAACLWLATTLAAAAPLLVPSHFNNQAAVDSSALGSRIPVVLVHGLGGGNEGWESFLRAYSQNPSWRAAFKPYSFSYATGSSEVEADANAPRSISALGAAFRDALQSYYDKPQAAPHFGFGNRRVIVLAHSMGGLVARSMMQEHLFADGQRGGQKVLHLITLATPHHGSQLADAAFTIGVQTVGEIGDTHPGFLNDLAWTNYDGLDMSSGRCNAWLSQLNNYAPSTGATHGKCGTVAANPLPGFYDKVIAYGVRELQSLDLRVGTGVFKPGSAPSLVTTYTYLRTGLSRTYDNDGVVPLASAQFDGAALWRRGEAFSCDHRYIKRAYQEFVRTSLFSSSYTDWAFCAAVSGQTSYPSGQENGYAISGSIFGVPGGIIDTIVTASQVERTLNWAEQAHGNFVQPAGMTTEIGQGFYYRYYPWTQSYVGVKDGGVWYLGPASNNQLYFVAGFSSFFAQAQAAGF
ncbi:MAG TPA: alpha/beta fold hydrolase [Ramlibacter sp.]|nr:alpha/beta fold hydrolase [Ramlibacter sp.]